MGWDSAIHCICLRPTLRAEQMIDAGIDKYPYLPVKLLLKDKYESDKKIKNINSPILIMHGKVDNIVPFHMGKKMFELANEPKYSYFSKYCLIPE